MGGSVEVTKRYFGNSKFQEYNQLSISDKMAIMDIFLKENKVAIGVGSKDSGFYNFINEFDVKVKIDSLIDLKRSSYNGNRRQCCLFDDSYYWIDPKGSSGKVPDNKSVLYTCDPDSKSLGKDSYCDTVMIEECVKNRNKQHELKCNIWFDNIVYRKELLSSVSNEMFKNCKDDVEETYCKAWLTAIRKLNDQDLNSLADTVIQSQKSKENFKCAYPPKHVEKEELRSLTPRECWYKNCVDAYDWELLTENIYRRKQCSIYECNINIFDMKISDLSDVKMICRNKAVVSNQNEDKYVLEKEMYYNMFLVTKYDILVILIVIVLFYLAFHNY